jgi:hypothetical protein
MRAQAGRASEIQQASVERGAAQAAYRARRSPGPLVVNERVDIPPADFDVGILPNRHDY